MRETRETLTKLSGGAKTINDYLHYDLNNFTIIILLIMSINDNEMEKIICYGYNEQVLSG